MSEALSPRAREIVAVARDVLETEGAEALTMRRLADRLGIRAPSLYRHLPNLLFMIVPGTALGEEFTVDVKMRGRRHAHASWLLAAGADLLRVRRCGCQARPTSSWWTPP
jgi:hypothetical protein